MNAWVIIPSFMISLAMTIIYVIRCARQGERPDPIKVMGCLTIGTQFTIGLYMILGVFFNYFWKILESNRYFIGASGAFIIFYFACNVMNIFNLKWEDIAARFSGRSRPPANM